MFYEDERGDKPVLRWIRENPTLATIAALAYALGAELTLEPTASDPRSRASREVRVAPKQPGWTP